MIFLFKDEKTVLGSICSVLTVTYKVKNGTGIRT